MKQEKNVMPEGFRVLNYAESAKTLDVSQVPVLVSDKALKALQKNDAEPFYKVEAIDYPVVGSGGVYEPSFFKSFINVLKDRPIPGSKRGHEWQSRPNNDFYMVGGKTVDNKDGTGTAYFLMYIPPTGDGTENYGFIRDAEAGLVNFSLVTRPEYNVQKDPKTGESIFYFTASKGSERNDAVEYGAGAMKQIVNSRDDFNLDEAREKIEHGLISRNDKGESLFVNGKVSRPMLRRMVSNADCENKPDIAELISLIDKKQNGGKPVELTEALEMVKNAAANGNTNLTELMKNCGAEKLLRTAADDEAVAFKNAMVAKLGDKPAERLDLVLAENKANAEAIAKNAVVAEFGAEKIKNGTAEIENPAHTYAIQKCGGKTGEELKNSLEALKDDVVMKGIRANQADPNSGINLVQNGGAKPTETAANAAVTY
jgi:hypothetical protein